MSEYQLINDMIQNLGIPVALIVYFVYKDWKFTARILEVMTQIKEYMGRGSN